eukprot:7711733-Alexandrium_andersonii.AAC.1
MSASLVGSEMCIRDRPPDSAGRPHGSRSERALRLPQALPQARGRRRGGQEAGRRPPGRQRARLGGGVEDHGRGPVEVGDQGGHCSEGHNGSP